MNGYLFQAGRVAVLVLGIAAGSAAHAQNATSGTIQFTGSIKDVPCDVDAAATSTSIDLGTNVDIQTLRGEVGKGSPAKNFTIALKGCGASVAGATLKFSGTTDSDNPKALVVTGGAAGIAVQLLGADGITAVDVGSDVPLAVKEGNNSYTYKARYISTKPTIKPGQANATLLFALTYK